MSQHQDLLTAAFHQVRKDVKMLTNPKTYQSLSQNQIITGLTVLLLVVGVATGVYLGQTPQDIRQLAYPGQTCTNGAGQPCSGRVDGDSCTVPGIGSGTCSANTAGSCTCVVGPTPTSSTCAPDGSACNVNNDVCCKACIGNTCSCVPNGTVIIQGLSVSDCCECWGMSGNDVVCSACPSSTPVPPNPCANPSQVPVSACGTGSCGSCQHQINLIGTNGAVCGSICSGTDNNCPGCGQVPTNTPAPPNVCENTTEEIANACNVNGCGPCDQSVTFRGSDGTTHCGHICRQNNAACGCGITPTNTPTPTATLPPGITPTATPTNTPVPPTPTNTPGIGPVCMSVTVNNPGSNNSPAPGDVITLTCAADTTIVNVDRFEFSMTTPGGVVMLNPQTPTSNVSQTYQIPFDQPGVYTARCQACIGATCSGWVN